MIMRKSNGMRVVLCVAAVVLLASGCESREFKAERALWKANKNASKIFKNPETVPPYELAIAVKTYEDIITRFSDTAFAKLARASIGALYVAKQDYPKAREEFVQLTTDCDPGDAFCARALFAIGKTYEQENQWEQAIFHYRRMLSETYRTQESWQVPLYILRHLKERKKGTELAAALKESIAFYRKHADETESDFIRYLALVHIARSNIVAQEWRAALASLDGVLGHLRIQKQTQKSIY